LASPGEEIPLSEETDQEMISTRRLSVFLCHASEDKPAVRDLYRRLLASGVDPWLDEVNILPGQDWQRTIRKAVRDADVVLVCLSRTAVAKDGYVHKEIGYALDIAEDREEQGIFIIPLRLEPCQVPGRLDQLQWVDLFEDRGYDQMMKALRVRAAGLGIAIKPPSRTGTQDALRSTFYRGFVKDSDSRFQRAYVWIGERLQDAQRSQFTQEGRILLAEVPAKQTFLVESSFSRYHDLLNEVCFEKPEQGPVKYQYDDHNAPLDPDLFDDSLADLAEFGQMLYGQVFGGTDWSYMTGRLRELEQETSEPVVIHIARENLDTDLPWSVLYDRPLLFDPRRNEVCRRFLTSNSCPSDCPNDGDLNIICPYGFWGFRYVIEQPLISLYPGMPAVTQLEVNERLRILLAYGNDLRFARRHMKAIGTMVSLGADIYLGDGTTGLLRDLQHRPTIVYAYSHSGNSRYRQWLRLGDRDHRDPLLPTYLDNGLRSVWAGDPPLIILNCDRGARHGFFSLSFLQRFSDLGAAGVIGHAHGGLHEYLASFFGQFFMSRLLKGEPAGKIIYDFRWELLRRHNPLGLVYTPYCYADLHIGQTDQGQHALDREGNCARITLG
jgi:hypothetical protein